MLVNDNGGNGYAQAGILAGLGDTAPRQFVEAGDYYKKIFAKYWVNGADGGSHSYEVLYSKTYNDLEFYIDGVRYAWSAPLSTYFSYGPPSGFEIDGETHHDEDHLFGTSATHLTFSGINEYDFSVNQWFAPGIDLNTIVKKDTSWFGNNYSSVYSPSTNPAFDIWDTRV